MYRLLGHLLTLVVLMSCCSIIPPAVAVAGSPDSASWIDINIPGDVNRSSQLLAEGSEVVYLGGGKNPDDVYAVVSGAETHLYLSSENHKEWEHLAGLKPGLVDFNASGSCAGNKYYATSTGVYRSEDDGGTFLPVANVPGVDDEGKHITSFDVGSWEGEEVIAVGTAGGDSRENGGVYILRPEQILARWQDTGLNAMDVYAVKFPPVLSDGLEMFAVGHDGNDCLIIDFNGSAGWGDTWGEAALYSNDGSSLPGLEGASVAFGADYDSPGKGSFTVALDSGNNSGGVYRLARAGSPEAVRALTLDAKGAASVDISTIEKGAGGALVAGAASLPALFISHDDGNSWEVSSKSPTGESVTGTYIADDGFYAATAGGQSAVSFSSEGFYWNQVAFIDTRIDAIVDFATHTDYRDDGILYLLTWGGGASLWRSEDGARTWERSFCSSSKEVVDLEKVALASTGDSQRPAVYLAGSSNNGPAIWEKTEGSASFKERQVPERVDCWAVAADGSLFFGGFDGSTASVYRTYDGGRSFDSSPAGSLPLHSLDVAGGIDNSYYVAAGDTAGAVYLSVDKGKEFVQAGNSTAPGLSGNITVLFDDSCPGSSRLYVATDEPDGPVFSLEGYDEPEWQELGVGPGMAGSMCVGGTGILYVASFAGVEAEKGLGGVTRVLHPGADGAVFDTLSTGIREGGTIWRIWAYGSGVWAMDTTHNRLLYYEDSQIYGPELVSPEDGKNALGVFAGEAVKGVDIGWEKQPGGILYQWQISTSPAFTSVPDEAEGSTRAGTARLPDLETNTGYYWRARVVSPVHSPWSSTFQFSTIMGGSMDVPGLKSPSPGAKTSLAPLFQWQTVAGAESYELVISRQSSFSQKVVERSGTGSLPANAWQSPEDLEPGTGYFWKIRALGKDSSSAWSDVGSFVTREASPEPSQTSPVPTTKPVAPQPVTTTVVYAPEVTVTSQPSEAPLHTVVVTRPPAVTQQPADPGLPGWAYLIIGAMGVIVFMLVIITTAVVTRSRK